MRWRSSHCRIRGITYRPIRDFVVEYSLKLASCVRGTTQTPRASHITFFALRSVPTLDLSTLLLILRFKDTISGARLRLCFSSSQYKNMKEDFQSDSILLESIIGYITRPLALPKSSTHRILHHNPQPNKIQQQPNSLTNKPTITTHQICPTTSRNLLFLSPALKAPPRRQTMNRPPSTPSAPSSRGTLNSRKS
jgi:hypothetical protein